MREVADVARHLPERGGIEPAVTERIGDVGIEAGGHQHQIGPVVEPDRHDEVLDRDNQTSSSEPAGTGRLIVYPRPSPEPVSISAPVPGKSPVWWMLVTSTSARRRKISAVPLPWWTSQSMIITFSTPCRRIASSAAMATLLKRQKPIARSRSAW